MPRMFNTLSVILDCLNPPDRGVRRCKFKWLPSEYEKELMALEEARKKKEKAEAEASSQVVCAYSIPQTENLPCLLKILKASCVYIVCAHEVLICSNLFSSAVLAAKD
jgi:hypothetical protein